MKVFRRIVFMNLTSKVLTNDMMLKIDHREVQSGRILERTIVMSDIIMILVLVIIIMILRDRDEKRD